MGAETFSGYLIPGESLVWWDQPRQGLMLVGRDALLIPFSLLWGGFAFFWEASVIGGNAPFFFMLWGVPFVLMGLYFIFGRFVVDAWARRVTHYALTNRRVLIQRGSPFTKLTALSFDQLPALEFTESRGGRGTIYFGPASLFAGNFSSRGGFGVWSPALNATPQFIGIADARNVFVQIQNSIARARTS